MRGIEVLQRAAAEQDIAGVQRPYAHHWLVQAGEVECMLAFRWRGGLHRGAVLFHEGGEGGVVEVGAADVHGRIPAVPSPALRGKVPEADGGAPKARTIVPSIPHQSAARCR